MKKDENLSLSKVRAGRLREHFRTTYRLAEDQIDLMLESTARSLNATLAALDQALENDSSLNEVAKLGHSIKGLLLNMGEFGWAEIARELEQAAAQGEQRDYRKLVKTIHSGVEDIL